MSTPARYRPRPEIWLLAAAAVLLLAQAVFHLLAYARLDAGLVELASLPMQLALPDFNVLRGAWVLYAVHLLIAALLSAACAVSPSRFGRGLRVALALWMSLDASVLLCFVGLFLGSILMALAALLLIIAALWPMTGNDRA